jgi:hypothetical protein
MPKPVASGHWDGEPLFPDFSFYDQCFPEALWPITAVGACVAPPPSMAAPVPGWPICEPFKAPFAVSGAAGTGGRAEWMPPTPDGAALAPGPFGPGPCTGPGAPDARLGAGRPIAFLAGVTGICAGSAGGCVTATDDCGAVSDFALSAGTGDTCWARHPFVAAAEMAITLAINPNLVKVDLHEMAPPSRQLKSKQDRAHLRLRRAADLVSSRGSCSSPLER